jgi:phage terminase large subunit-like protein
MGAGRLADPTPGNEVDYPSIRATIGDLSGRFAIQEIAFDPWNATETAQLLGNEGFTMVKMRQGFRTISEPSKRFEAAVLDKRIGHLTPKGAHPVMRWNIANVTIEEDAHENIKPTKPREKARIDGVPASIMAVARATLSMPPDDGSWLLFSVPQGG